MATPSPEEIERNRTRMLSRVAGFQEVDSPDTLATLLENRRTGEDGGRYDEFLSSRGVDPNTIGQATLTDYYGDRRLDIPSVDAEYDAINAGNQMAGYANRSRIAANDARSRGRSDLWAQLMNEADLAQAQTGDSFEQNRSYWLNRLRGAYDYRRSLLDSNGYAGQ